MAALALGDEGTTEERYLRCWRITSQRASRERKLMRLALRIMQHPAQASGLSDLQQFLENGFAAFATLGDASEFLDTISEREGYRIKLMLDETPTRCVQLLRQELAGV